MQHMMDGKLLEVRHPDQHYRTLFDQRTGFFVRKEEPGWPEPTWAKDGPELIDLSITSYCQRRCSFCYRRANDTIFTHLDTTDIRHVVEQAAKCGTLQIALGGGNPNQHPDFVEILRLIREHDIVPTYTSNGDGLTGMVLKATAKYCGAMAISVYPPFSEVHYNNLIETIESYGIKVNLHAIIRNDYLELWTKWLYEPPAFMRKVNAIIFLNYKPIATGDESLLPKEMGVVERFFYAANKCKSIKVGFDSCSISGITRWMDVPNVLIESCEAARFSAFISEDMKMYPCSFMIKKGYCGDLREQSLLNIWQNNEYFHMFRSEAVPTRCNKCSKYEICKGGCHLYPTINFC